MSKSNAMPNQDISRFLQFVAFCDSQPIDKPINHYTWRTCAIGEFLESEGRKLLQPISSNDHDLVAILGYEHSRLSCQLGAGHCPDNYGEFTEWLKAWDISLD
jgi:hypothetical protein